MRIVCFLAAAFAELSLQDTGGTIKLKPDGSCSVITPEGHYVELNITFLENYGFLKTCHRGTYLHIRDGVNEAAHLLAVFCEFYKNKEYIFRSSGRHMWLKLYGSYRVHDDDFYAKYSVKPVDVTGTCSFPSFALSSIM